MLTLPCAATPAHCWTLRHRFRHPTLTRIVDVYCSHVMVCGDATPPSQTPTPAVAPSSATPLFGRRAPPVDRRQRRSTAHQTPRPSRSHSAATVAHRRRCRHARRHRCRRRTGPSRCHSAAAVARRHAAPPHPHADPPTPPTRTATPTATPTPRPPTRAPPGRRRQTADGGFPPRPTRAPAAMTAARKARRRPSCHCRSAATVAHPGPWQRWGVAPRQARGGRGGSTRRTGRSRSARPPARGGGEGGRRIGCWGRARGVARAGVPTQRPTATAPAGATVAVTAARAAAAAVVVVVGVVTVDVVVPHRTTASFVTTTAQHTGTGSHGGRGAGRHERPAAPTGGGSTRRAEWPTARARTDQTHTPATTRAE